MAAEEVPSVYIANPVHRVALRNHIQGYRYVGLLGYDLAFYHLRVQK